MKLQDIQRAFRLAEELKFEGFGAHESMKRDSRVLDNGMTIPDYYENYMELFSDSDDGFYTLQLHEGGWMMCYDDEPLFKIYEKLSKALDQFREEKLREPELKLQRQKDFVSFQEELWRDHGSSRY